MRFSRQGYWNGLPFPSPGDLPNPGIKPGSPALQAESLPTELQGKPVAVSPAHAKDDNFKRGLGHTAQCAYATWSELDFFCRACSCFCRTREGPRMETFKS